MSEIRIGIEGRNVTAEYARGIGDAAKALMDIVTELYAGPDAPKASIHLHRVCDGCKTPAPDEALPEDWRTEDGIDLCADCKNGERPVSRDRS